MTGFDLSSAQAIYLGNSLVDSVYIGSTKIWPSSHHDYSRDYLTFEVLEAGTITITASNNNVAKTIQYSTDNGSTWNSLTTSTTEQSFGTFAVGNKVLVKGENVSYCNNTSNYNNHFGGTAKTNVYGNILSLCYGDNFIGQTTLTGSWNFHYLFYNYSNFISGENLILPLTSSGSDCYNGMFYGCSGLIIAPSLNSYVGQGTHSQMFMNCSSLTTAPVLLNSGTVPVYGYYEMFRGCSSLNYIEVYATGRNYNNSTTNWVYGVSESGTFKCYDNVWPTGTSGIPSNWTVEYITS